MNDMNWPAVYPEIFLLAMGCLVALVDLWVTDPAPPHLLAHAAQPRLDGVDALQPLRRRADRLRDAADGGGRPDGAFARRLCLRGDHDHPGLRPPCGQPRDAQGRGGEIILSVFSLLGINVMLAANNFLVIYLGLELMSLSLYALVALRRSRRLHRGGDEVLRARCPGQRLPLMACR